MSAWYDKHPDAVTDSEKEKLFDDALEVLRHYDVARALPTRNFLFTCCN